MCVTFSSPQGTMPGYPVQAAQGCPQPPLTTIPAIPPGMPLGAPPGVPPGMPPTGFCPPPVQSSACSPLQQFPAYGAPIQQPVVQQPVYQQPAIPQQILQPQFVPPQQMAPQQFIPVQIVPASSVAPFGGPTTTPAKPPCGCPCCGARKAAELAAKPAAGAPKPAPAAKPAAKPDSITAIPGTVQYNVQVVKKVAKELGVDPVLAVAMMLVESGGNAKAVGDNGTSFGLFQLHKGGMLTSAGLTPEQAYNPETNARVSLKSLKAYQAKKKYASPGHTAAASQRPANPEGYAQKVNTKMAEARKLLGM